MYKFYHPQRADLVLERVLSALAHPLRLEIVRRLSDEGDLSCGDLTGARPKSSMSHHFKILHEAGVIKTIVRGTVHTNSLRIEDIDDRYPGLLSVVLHDGRKPVVAKAEPEEQDEPIAVRKDVPELSLA